MRYQRRSRLSSAVLLVMALLPRGAAQAVPAGPEALEALRGRLESHEYEEILASARDLLEDSRDDPALTADILDLMVETLRLAGRATDPEGRALGERAVRLRTEAAGPDDPSVARSLSLLGSLLSHAGELDEAAAAHRRALAIYEKAHGPGSRQAAQALDNLADVQQKQAAFDEALANYRRALAINEKIHGSHHLRVADTLYDMGNLGIRTGDYAAARDRYERALEIYEAEREPGHLDISMTKITLGYLLSLTGDLPRARELLEEAVAEITGSLGAGHPLASTALGNLGTVLYAMEDFEAARPVFARVLESRERSLGPDHTDTADAALNLGAALRETGRSAEALPLYRRALAIYEKNLGESHPRVAELLVNLANAQVDSGNLAEAIAMYRRSLDIRLKALGRSHPDTARSHEMLAGALWASGDRAGALEHAAEASRLLDRHTRETVAFLPEREALLMVSGRARPEALLFLGLSGDPKGREGWLRACWDWALRSRALVLDELARRNRAVQAEGEEAARAAWEDLSRARQAVADLWVRGPGESPSEFDRDLSRARERKEQRELRLARLSAEYGREHRARAAGLEEIRAALPPSSALLEYVRVEVGAPTDRARSQRYFALILSGNGEPGVVDLGPADGIDRRISGWRRALEASGRRVARGGRGEDLLREVEESGARLREAIWDPAASLLGEAGSVFVVPDGLLHNVDLNALPAAGGGYLIERDPVVHLLDSGRDLVRLEHPGAGDRRGSRGALILGAPAFGVPSVAPREGGPRGGSVACDPRQGSRWPDLPESAREADAVGRLLGAGGPSRVLTGDDASEARFKKEAPGSDILHLATHGFFLHGQCVEDEAAMNPLLLSGLVLAGANAEAGEAGADGYLTSEELAALDLDGVSLAVLSACDTGRGRIETGEGVLGLRRSLALAGARTVVMSLWRVPDREARRWMTSFYEARAGGESIREAARLAGLRSLERLRRRRIPPHPYLWAGFVASGDWR